jgi:hypothetical protein
VTRQTRGKKKDEPAALVSVRLLEHLILFKLGPVENVVDDAGLGDCSGAKGSISTKKERSEKRG